METNQMYLFRNTCSTNVPIASPASRDVVGTARVPSTSGRPTDGGVSASVNQRKTKQTSAMIAGTKKQRRHPYVPRYPVKISIATPPMQWDVFQIDILVASLRGGNQCVSRRAQGGKPIPCTQPLSIQNKPNANTVELSPKHKLNSAEAAKPTTMNDRALHLSAKKPLANLETP